MMASVLCLQITGNKEALGKEHSRGEVFQGTGETGKASLGIHTFCSLLEQYKNLVGCLTRTI